MAEYIDKSKIPWAKVDNPAGVFWERIVFESAINNITPADVVERTEYDELNEKYFKAIHNHTECLKKLHEYRSKVNKAIEEMEKLSEKTNTIEEYELIGKCILILKEI